MGAPAYLLAATPPRLAVSGLGVALPILAVESGDGLALGGALAAAALGPSILAAPVAGVLMDRARRPGRWVALAGFVLAAAYALAAFLGPVPFWAVCVALAISGAFTPFTMGGLSSFAPSVIAEERRAFAVDALAYNTGSVVGPALVAATAVVGSARPALLLLAALALLGVGGAALAKLRPRAPHDERTGVLAEIRAGLAHITRHRPIALVTASGTINQFGAGALAISAVALAIALVGDAARGAVIVTAFAIGGLVGALWGSARPSRRPPEWGMGVGFAATGAFTLLAALDFGFVWAVLAIGVSGLFTAPSSAAMLVLRTRQSPPALRAQVFTVGSGLRAAASAAGAFVAGLLVEDAGWGAAAIVVAMGLIWIISGAMLAWYPKDAPRLDTTA
ncbi:MFS transporter [Agromyces seonyuensis]|uniref:MFS transporter n=1 Tax=Agromyces seonyuensis TaxID=2662446 RepID=A0A6I4NYJ0_9MICO|nr:MFS transporter [Agromyces seonyuensis]MWB99383.1 MFS transporter [Agromyces seonyuensis]